MIYIPKHSHSKEAINRPNNADTVNVDQCEDQRSKTCSVSYMWGGDECDRRLHKTKLACQFPVCRWSCGLNAATQTWSATSKPVPHIYSMSPWHFSWPDVLSRGGWNRSGRMETVWPSRSLQRPWYGSHQREERGSRGGLPRKSDLKSPEGDCLYHVRQPGGARQHE